MKDTELLQFVHATAEMGVKGLRDVTGQIKDAQLQKAVQGQMAEYENIAQTSGAMLRSKGESPKKPAMMAQISSEIVSTVQTLADSSASKIAEMVIKGNNMGITKGTKHLHDYEGDDRQVRALAEKLLSTEEANVEQMKPFL